MHGLSGDAARLEQQPPIQPVREAAALKVLLAQFHPYADDSAIVPVARVVCDGGQAWIEPVAVDGAFTTTAGMLAKLRYLVERSGPIPFERLPQLRSRFWSFVKIEASAVEIKQ
jgi:hypothetical protein